MARGFSARPWVRRGTDAEHPRGDAQAVPGHRAPFILIKKELDSPPPHWEKIGEAAKEFMALAEMLDRNEPKWGEKDSWTRFTAQPTWPTPKVLEDAAGARSRGGPEAVHRRLENACKACHDVHWAARRE